MKVGATGEKVFCSFFAKIEPIDMIFFVSQEQNTRVLRWHWQVSGVGFTDSFNFPELNEVAIKDARSGGLVVIKGNTYLGNRILTDGRRFRGWRKKSKWCVGWFTKVRNDNGSLLD